MDLIVILENIQRRLRLKKISADKASQLAKKPDAIRNIKRKIKGEIQGDGITLKTLEALATVLETTVEDLTAHPSRITDQPIGGLRKSIMDKIAWLDKERERAVRDLDAIEQAEASDRNNKPKSPVKPAKQRKRA